MSDEFLNGYHFVPRAAPDNEAWLEGQGEIERNLAPYDGSNPAPFGLTPGTITDGHAVYAPGRKSGRITCVVKLECPTVIGSKRYSGGEGAERYAVVEPFLYQGKPAIPATSLKGMISSIAEAASRSAYRALGNSILTVAYSPDGGDPRTSWDHAVSGIRGRIGTTHDYFRDIDKADPARRDAPLPFTLTRSEVSPAEAMFGYVRGNESDKNARNRLVAVAGKLRFSLATPCGEWAARKSDDFFMETTRRKGEHNSQKQRREGYVVLKEMGEPMKKPYNEAEIKDRKAKQRPTRRDGSPHRWALMGTHDPAGAARKDRPLPMRSATPTMYFLNRANPDAPISKKAFGTTDPTNFKAQGGKFYLHHVDAAEGEPWATKVAPEADDGDENAGAAAGRKSAVRPLRAGVTFRFHVDFDNLTERELNLLCFALQPSTAFRHKIGMGKGIGLGSIEIVPEALRIVDRPRRYSTDGILAEEPPPNNLLQCKCLQAKAQAHRDWLDRNDRSALHALLTIGETHPFGKSGAERDKMIPVLWVPLASRPFQDWKASDRSSRAEQKSFQWFSNNETWFSAAEEPGGSTQKLRPIGLSENIPALRVNDRHYPTTASPARKSRARRARDGWLTGTIKSVLNGGFAFVAGDGGTGNFYVSPPLVRKLGIQPSEGGISVEFTYDAGARREAGKSPPVTAIARL